MSDRDDALDIEEIATTDRPIAMPDELPILGPMAGVEGYLNACGHFRTGVLTSAITGVLLDKLVNDEPLPLDITPFLADRFEVAPAKEERELEIA